MLSGLRPCWATIPNGRSYTLSRLRPFGVGQSTSLFRSIVTVGGVTTAFQGGKRLSVHQALPKDSVELFRRHAVGLGEVKAGRGFVPVLRVVFRLDVGTSRI